MLKSNYEPGFYPDLPNELYHADGAISASGIKTFCELPDLYYRTYLAEKKLERDTSTAMRTGSSAHVFLLEPEKFKQYFEVAPLEFYNERTKKVEILSRRHGEWTKLEEQASNSGKVLLLDSEYKSLPPKTQELVNDEFVYRVFSTPGYVEASFFAKDPITGLPLRAKPDKLVEIPGKGIFIIDYKTSGRALDDDSQNLHAQDQMRYIQGAFHKKVIELVLGKSIAGVVYITQWTKEPYYVRTFQLPGALPDDFKDSDCQWDDWIECGDRINEMALTRIKECLERGHFPGWPRTIQYYGQLKPWHRDKLPMGLREEIYN